MYSQHYPNLFKPLQVKGLTFKNRIMSPPNMLFHTVAGRPTQYYISYLEHKARGGAALVTLGEISVCDGGNHTPGMEWTRDNLPLFAEMSAAIHEHGAIASVELTHGGMKSNPIYNIAPIIGPVKCVNHLGAKVEAMNQEDMDHVADAFAVAADYWYKAGFDTVLIHAGHGWLLTQFLSPITNKRTDEYGGSLENRMKFPLMVLKRIRDQVGPKQVIMIRLSGSERDPLGFTVDDMITFLEQAQKYVDLAEISVEGLTNFFASTYMPLGQNLDLAETIKKSSRIQIPIFSIGSILHPEQAEEIIATGIADGVAMSRALIADPFLPKKAKEGRADEVIPCLRCLNCTDSDNNDRHLVCSVNPLIGREARLGFADTMGKANYSKKVLIAGGGPAGMQAAITAAQRGHEVILCERSDSLGGLLAFTDTDSLKHDLRCYKDYLICRVNSLHIKVMLNTEVNDEVIKMVNPDSIIVATGSTPLLPKTIQGIDKAHHATDIYFSSEKIKGDNIVMIGGGLVGVEAGLHLANLGKKVTVLELLDVYAPEAKRCYKLGLIRKVEELGLNIISGAHCKEVVEGGVKYEKDGKEYMIEGDTIFYAVGLKSNKQPYFEMYNKAANVYEIGDCKKVGKVDGAVHSAYFAAMDIGML